MATSSWVICASSHARLRLFCFPHAGGGASLYRQWSELLPEGVDICPLYLPGRENRLSEPCFRRLAPLVEALAEALSPYMNVPFAFFGHSMGALISFELARYLRKKQRPGPQHLFVAAYRAPQLPDRYAPLHDLSDGKLIEMLSRFRGTPQAVLQHTELIKVFLPMLRADFELCETYIYLQEPPLSCPISVFGGEKDTLITTRELQAWNMQTRHTFKLNMLPGDHFFLNEQRELLLKSLSSE